MISQYAAYQKVEKSTLSDRQVQARILRHAANWMVRARETKNVEELNAALSYNMQFWTLVQSDCLTNDCVLPKELQANLLSLSIYMDKNTFKLMADPSDVGTLNSMVFIDEAIAKGLEE